MVAHHFKISKLYPVPLGTQVKQETRIDSSDSVKLVVINFFEFFATVPTFLPGQFWSTIYLAAFLGQFQSPDRYKKALTEE
jgi:hypothetical protein